MIWYVPSDLLAIRLSNENSGFCSREQIYRPEACGICKATLVGKAGSGFWEGGKGTRNRALMSRKGRSCSWDLSVLTDFCQILASTREEEQRLLEDQVRKRNRYCQSISGTTSSWNSCVQIIYGPQLFLRGRTGILHRIFQYSYRISSPWHLFRPTISSRI